jgi:hypothetical protein
LTLCVHGASHAWNRLKWICDVAELIRSHTEMKWGPLMEQARALCRERVLFLGLYLAHDLLGAPLPDDILYRVKADPSVKALADKVRESFLIDPTGISETVRTKERIRFSLKARECMRDKARYCYQLAAMPNLNDLEVLSLPPPLTSLYTLLPPLVLVKRAISRILRR